MISTALALAIAVAPQLRPRADAPPPPPPAATPPPNAEQVDAAAAVLLDSALAGEPPLGAVQQAAARHAIRWSAPATAARRARLAALLPKLSVELRRDDRRYHVSGLTSSAEVDYVRHTPGDQYGVRLSWDLGGLAFADAELRIADKEEALARARADAVDRATRLYFERRRLLLALATTPATTARERAERELELEELGGVLDELTGGLWSSGGAR